MNKVYQNLENIYPIVDKRFLHCLNSKKDKSILEIGGVYEYKPPICDDYDIPSRKYQLKHIVNKNDMEILIVKPLDQGGHFVSIPRHICDYLGIPFEYGLTMLSRNIKLSRIETEEKECEFDGTDMSTYPSFGGKIYTVIIKLSGFTSYRPTHFITSNGFTMSPSDFMKNLEVQYLLGTAWYDGINCRFENITNAIISPDKMRIGSVCDIEGNIFLLVYFDHPIDVSTIKGKRIQDIISVCWFENERKNIDSLFATPKFQPTFERDMKDGVIRVDNYGRAEMRKNGQWVSLSQEEFNKIRGQLAYIN